MKNIKKSFITILILLIFSGCSMIPNVNTYVCIYDCEHGTLEVKIKEQTDSTIVFLIIPHPETGYSLKKDNLIINYYNENENWQHYITPQTMDDEKYYIFRTDYRTKVTISAVFTKTSKE